MVDLRKVETLVRFAEKLFPESSYTIDELSKVWGLSISDTRKILRKLRREGFLKRTRRGRYKLSLAGLVIVELFKKVREL